MLEIGAAPPPRDVLASASLFNELSPDQLANLEAVCVVGRYHPGEVIVREGDTDRFLHVISEGRAQVVKRSTLGGEPIPVGEAHPGDVLGELQIVDPEPRSASVVAVTLVRTVAIDLDAFAHTPVLAEARTSVLQDVGRILARRLRSATGNSADALYRQLEESRARVYAGRFIALMFGMLASYQLLLSALALVPATHRPPDAILSFVFILWTVVPMLLALRRSPFPLRSYGLTLDRAGSVALSAVLWTTPLLVALVLLKLALMRWVEGMADRPLFDPTALFAGRPFDLSFFVLAVVMYCVHTPLQEFVTRAGLQGTLQHLHPAPPGHTNWRAILISNLMFASAHAYIGFWFCVAAFIPGLFWGWLFSRQRSLVGVTVSHVLVGLWGIFALGVHAVIGGG